MQTHSNQFNINAGTLVSFDDWINSLGKTRTTGWRWRKGGLIRTVNIFGKLYISREEIDCFEKRAIAGQFHRESGIPSHRATPAQ